MNRSEVAGALRGPGKAEAAVTCREMPYSSTAAGSRWAWRLWLALAPPCTSRLLAVKPLAVAGWLQIPPSWAPGCWLPAPVIHARPRVAAEPSRRVGPAA